MVLAFVTVLKLDAVQVLALACFGVAIGVWLKRKLPILDRLNIPASIAGGLVYALIALLLRDRYLNVEMDLALRDILMIAFFTTVGMSASLRLVRVGGVQVLLFFGVATLGAVLQNLLGMGVAKLLGIDPALGIIAGSVSLTGGPATALAFGATFEKLGVAGASTLGLASATFGITAGGLLGGLVGASLIRRYRLKPLPKPDPAVIGGTAALVYAGDPMDVPASPLADESESEHSPLFRTVILIAVAMGIGSLIGAWFGRLGLILPAYIGAMIAAAIIRNLDDRFQWFGVSQHLIDAVGNISLYIFIVMALLTLRLWELVHLALPVVVMLALQVALVWLLCVTLCFRAMGRDYESAVMAGGFCGFMLGTTANAIACMDVLVRKFGPAPRAFIVVPVVGAFLIDFTNALVITTMINFLR
jgi:ESS family glutamate:Na+ symporter